MDSVDHRVKQFHEIMETIDADGFLSEFQRESDRSAAILAAAFLDEALGRILKKSMIANKKLTDKLLGPVGPLGSFGSRILICYLLGRISDEEYRDLEVVRKIRNDFAHKMHGMSFETEGIKGRCSNLILANKVTTFKQFEKAGARERFNFSIVLLMALLGMRETNLDQVTSASSLFGEPPSTPLSG